MLKKEFDIHERIYQFTISVLKLLVKLPKNDINIIIVNQCGRSATSVGANDQEADACESNRDFIAKYSLVKKEIKETNYWIRLAGDINNQFSSEIISLQKEGQEIFLIVSSIIRNAKRTKMAKRNV